MVTPFCLVELAPGGNRTDTLFFSELEPALRERDRCRSLMAVRLVRSQFYVVNLDDPARRVLEWDDIGPVAA